MTRCAAALIFALFLFLPTAEAQTLQSITITGFVPTGTSTSEQLRTGASVTLTAIGTYSNGTSQPILAMWSSSDTSTVSVNSGTGTVTGVAGTLTPVTITAASGGMSSNVTFTVLPQTALYAVDGDNTLYVYDNTEASINGKTINANPPPLITSLKYETSTTGANGNNYVPMALSQDQRYLFIANPAYSSSNLSDFGIAVIDTQNNYAVVQTVSTGSGKNILTDDNLCYPTSLAVGSNLYIAKTGVISTSFLFVVNAGTSVAQGTAASCSSGSSGGNVQVFAINSSSGLLQLYDTITSADLVNAKVNPIPKAQAGNYIPLLVAGSSDQQDQSVYIAWTRNYASTGTGPGIITPISLTTDTNNLNGSMNPNSSCGLYPEPPPASGNATPPPPGDAICQVIPLSSGTTTSGFNISPLTMAVATIYPTATTDPTWGNGGPIHTVLYTGPGFNSTLGSSSFSNNSSWGYFSDDCDTSINTSCPTYSPSSPKSIYPSGPAGPTIYTPAASTSSPTGYVYAVSQTDYLEVFDPSGPEPTTSGQLIYSLDGFTTTQGTHDNCTTLPTPCVPLTGITSRADASSLFLGAVGQLSVLSPPPSLTAGTPNATSPLGVLLSQAPEVQLFLNQSGQNIVGGANSTYFTVKGNFQNQASGTVYAASCNWVGTALGLWSQTQAVSIDNGPIGAAGGTIVPSTPTPYSQSTFTAQVIPAVTDTNQTNGGIITGISVGPVTSLISAESATVLLRGQSQLTSVVSNAGTDGAITSWYINGATCVPGGTTTCPFGYVDTNGNYNAPSALPALNMTNVSICALPAAINSSDTVNTSTNPTPCMNTTVTYTANSNTTVTASTPYSNTITLTLSLLTPTVTVTPSSSSITTGQALSVTVSVSGSNGSATPTGSVTLTSGSYSSAATTLSSGSATITIPAGSLATGTDTLTASYTPDSSSSLIYNSTTGSSDVTVTTASKATPTVTVTPSSSSITTAQALSVTISVSGGKGSPTPTGSVTLTSGSYSSPATTLTSGGATITIPAGSLATGTDTLSASYSGDSNYTTASASAMTVVTATSGPTATLSTPSLNFVAQSIGTTSAAQSVMVTNTGQANLVLAASPLSIMGASMGDFAVASGTTCTANLSIAPGGSCVTNLTFTPNASGSRTAILYITDNSGGGAGTTQMVSLSGTGETAVTMSLYPPGLALEPGASQLFTALFQPSSAAGPVTWSVSGLGCNGKPCGNINTSGVYSAPASIPGPAVDTVTATLVSNQAVSGSTQVTLFLQPAVSGGQSETVSSGQAATYQLTLAPGTGDANAKLTIECFQETLPTGVSCQPVTVQPGATAASFSFVVQTTGTQTGAIPHSRIVLAGFFCVLPAWVLALFHKGRAPWLRRGNLLILFFSTIAVCFCLSGCGTGGSFGSSTTKTFTTTPRGTYRIQLAGVEPNGTTDPNIGTITLVVQ